MLIVADDEALPVAAARRGNADAWTALFRRYQLPLYAFVMELVHHNETALDVVQETFVQATRHITSLREDARFGSWLFSIAHQKCQQHWRKPRCAESPVEECENDLGFDNDSPEELLIQREQEEEFFRVLNQLPEHHRAVLLLHFLEDFSLEEIARITETNVGTVKSRLHYAKKQMRKLLEAAR